MTLLKLLLGFLFYDFVFKPMVKAFIKVVLRHSKTARGLYFRLIHYFIRKGYIKIDTGDEYERRRRINVGDLILVKSAEFGDEVTYCTELDKETMLYKFSDRYFKIIGV